MPRTFTLANAVVTPTPTVKGTLPTPDGGTVGMAYRMGLAQFFDNVGASTTYSVQGATCAGFEVSGANLVGTNSGSIPSSVTTDVPCTIRATNSGVSTTADAMFTIGITVPTPTPTVKGTLPTPDGGTVGMAYRMGLAQFFDNVGASTTYSVQGSTCAGFEVSGANLVGTESGSIPSSVTADVPCTIRATNSGVSTTADAMFTIGITVPTPTVQIVSVTAANSGTGAITVTLSQSGTSAISGVTVNVASTSNPGADYVTAQDYTGNFTDGSNITITISRITGNEPAANANAKTLTVTLTDGSAYNLGTNTSATADLRDSRPYFGVPSSQTVAASDDPFRVNVRRYGNNASAVGSVNVSVTNATGQDAVAVVATSTLNFAISDDEEPVFVSRTSPPPSGTGNGMAVVTVTTGTGYGLASGNVSQTFAITRAAATPVTPTVSISGNNFPSSITEGSSGTITLERSGATTAALQAYVSVASTSFTSNIFGASFATGSPTATVTVNIPANTVSTNETATVTVLTPTQAAGGGRTPGTYIVGSGTALMRTFTLANAVVTPTVTLGTVTADASNITVPVTQSGAAAISGVTVSVSSSSNPGAIYVTAQSYNVDLTGASGSITIPRVITNEPSSGTGALTLTVTLTDGSAYNLGTNTSATVDLRDSRPYFGVPSSQTVAANADPFRVSVRRYGNNTSAAGSVNVSVTNATGQDAVAVVATSTLNFVASDDDEMVFVSRTSPPPSGTGNGMVVVAVTAGTGYGLASGNVSQTFAITRAAATPTTPTVSISGNNFPSSITEGSSGTVILERSGATTAALQAYVSVASTSFTSNIFGASFATGSATATVTVNIPANTVSTNETATVTVLTPTQAAGGGRTPGTYIVGSGTALMRTFTLANAGAPPATSTVSISASNFPSSITEGSSGMVTLGRSGATTATLQAYVRVTSASFTSNNIFSASFATGSATATVTVNIPANTVSANETATVTVLTPTQAAGGGAPPAPTAWAAAPR